MPIMWQRLDLPGFEIAELVNEEQAPRLFGTVLVAHDDRPCHLEYRIDCDAEWRTSHVHIHGALGSTPVQLQLTRSANDRWEANGHAIAAVDGCLDVDLAFSPATNLLPIRRLRLQVGETASVRAAWVRFPELTLEVLEQTYSRVEQHRYHYESAGGAFQRDLEVDEHGFVVAYPGLWRAVRVSTRRLTRPTN